MDRQRRTLLWVIVLVGLFAATTALGLACASSGDDDDDDDTADDDTADDDDTTDDDTSDDDTVDDDDDDLGDDDTTIADTFSEAEANVGDWVWIPVVGNLCRDGSQTGIAVRLQEGEGSDDLMIFLQGGGACADKDSCDANPAKYGKTQMQADTSLNAGILSDGTGSESNVSEFANWNNVVIPYCTGDLHVGFEENGKAEGVEARQIYVGIRNMRNVADLIGQYFTGLKRVFIVGQDAGGMGTNWAAIEFEAAFDDNTIRVFNDSF
ncbi:MAG: hypothetical protein H6685_12050, partial [Deltaproteobacteria bacterium]|nr:hypothetical protein [Deltaproteobacteria bacterium]